MGWKSVNESSQRKKKWKSGWTRIPDMLTDDWFIMWDLPWSRIGRGMIKDTNRNILCQRELCILVGGCSICTQVRETHAQTIHRYAKSLKWSVIRRVTTHRLVQVSPRRGSLDPVRWVFLDQLYETNSTETWNSRRCFLTEAVDERFLVLIEYHSRHEHKVHHFIHSFMSVWYEAAVGLA